MNASIEFFPPLACGVGSGDSHAPWGTKWFGKGAADGAWFNNFRIPFKRSVKVTTQSVASSFGGFYIIVRGAPNLPIVIGDYTVPAAQARLTQFRYQGVRMIGLLRILCSLSAELVSLLAIIIYISPPPPARILNANNCSIGPATRGVACAC